MEKGDNILIVDKALNSLYSNRCMGQIKTIENKFDYILRENDLLYESKIKFEVSKVPKKNIHKIKLIPCKEGFDSQKYFWDSFDNEDEREKLNKFNKENSCSVLE